MPPSLLMPQGLCTGFGLCCDILPHSAWLSHFILISFRAPVQCHLLRGAFPDDQSRSLLDPSHHLFSSWWRRDLELFCLLVYLFRRWLKCFCPDCKILKGREGPDPFPYWTPMPNPIFSERINEVHFSQMKKAIHNTPQSSEGFALNADPVPPFPSRSLGCSFRTALSPITWASAPSIWL